jgi:hypothetical protein
LGLAYGHRAAGKASAFAKKLRHDPAVAGQAGRRKPKLQTAYLVVVALAASEVGWMGAATTIYSNLRRSTTIFNDFAKKNMKTMTCDRWRVTRSEPDEQSGVVAGWVAEICLSAEICRNPTIEFIKMFHTLIISRAGREKFEVLAYCHHHVGYELKRRWRVDRMPAFLSGDFRSFSVIYGQFRSLFKKYFHLTAGR